MATDHELALYVMTGCPYCIKVKRFLADNGVTIPERNISIDSDAEQTLIAVGGKRQGTVKILSQIDRGGLGPALL